MFGDKNRGTLGIILDFINQKISNFMNKFIKI